MLRTSAIANALSLYRNCTSVPPTRRRRCSAMKAFRTEQARASAKKSSSSNDKDEEKKKKKKKKKKEEEKTKKSKKKTKDNEIESLRKEIKGLQTELATTLSKIGLEVRARQPEREPKTAPSATEVIRQTRNELQQQQMQKGFDELEEEDKAPWLNLKKEPWLNVNKSNGASYENSVLDRVLSQSQPKRKGKSGDDDFVKKKAANDLLTPALGVTIQNADKIIVDAANWTGDSRDRGNEWPLLRNGDNDVYLMTLSHAALIDNGFWPGEDDTEEMYFGKKTEEAVEFLQGDKKIEVTGMINTKTWLALLGKEKFKWGPAPGAIFEEDVASCREGSARKAFEETQQVNKMKQEEDLDPYGEDIDSGPPAEDDFIDVKGVSGEFVEWPILRLDDGGLAVHKMQTMLSKLGFNCDGDGDGDSDSSFWFLGPDTQNALQTFQASESLPETGVVDFLTWQRLFKASGFHRATELTCDEAFALIEDDKNYSVDRAPGCEGEQGVWLIGEQRYEIFRSKSSSPSSSS